MELKGYQQAALKTLRDYLEALRKAQAKREQIAALGLDIPYEWDRDAWRMVRGDGPYLSRKNGSGAETPAICLKIPTGGGKTLLAVKAIDAINNIYRGTRTGLVLWIVPTTQIYRQTLQGLRDRAHPYRQSLDLASGGRTLIVEKETRFSPLDVQESLTVLLLMLPSANRLNKETLRIFQDHGGFEAFFPAEDNHQAQAELLRRIPNLDRYGSDDGMFGQIAKTSLGNTLRLLNPLIILDEGHKAYSPAAQQTLLGFNPSFILELSATPTPQSNVLVNISGLEVHREGMIKLDLHLYHRASADWRDTLRASHRHLLRLDQVARDYEADSGVYIRPIGLIQVERTGEKQRQAGFIHAEDARQFLIDQCGLLPTEIAVKSSERDEIENIDLLSRDCPIRYVITRQALQEGWDCPFAYILTVLTNPEATASITQLVGRVLRQPYARKTGHLELDESYVYCYRDRAGDLLRAVRAGLQSEGLGDLTGRVVSGGIDAGPKAKVDVEIRPQFKRYAGKVYLPCFVVPDGRNGFREIQYEIDILSRINWNHVDLSLFDTLQLNPTTTQNTHTRISIKETLPALHTDIADDMAVDPVFMTRQLLEIVPNPWVAYEFVEDTLRRLRASSWDDRQIRRDLGFVIEELRKRLISERERLARDVFLGLIDRNELRFFLLSGCPGAVIPDRISVPQGRRLTTATGDQLQRSIFDYVVEDDLNGLEQSVALYLDQQAWVLAWYKSIVRLGYSIQGWHQHRIYPDFTVFRHDAAEGSELPPVSTIHVLETKGLHLKNEDTSYKQEVFKLCNALSKPTPWDAIAEEFSDHKVHFQVVFEDEWQRVLNALLSN